MTEVTFGKVLCEVHIFCLLSYLVSLKRRCHCSRPVGGDQNAGQVPSLHVESVLKPNKNKVKDVFSVQEGEEFL